MYFHWQIVCLVFAAACELALMWLVRSRARMPATNPFLLGVGLAALWAINYAVDLSSSDMESKLLLLRLRMCIIPVLPLIWCESVYRYTRGRSYFTGWRLAAGLAVPVVTALTVWFPQVPPLLRLYSDYWLDSSGTLTVLRFHFGPWVLMLFIYSMVLMGAALVLMVRTRFNTVWERRGRWLCVVAIVLGCALNLARGFRLGASERINYGPIFAPITFGVVAYALLRGRILDLAPVARAALIESLEDPIVVVDVDQRVVDLNRAAEALLRCDGDNLHGAPAEALRELWTAAAPHCVAEKRAVAEIALEGRSYELSVLPVAGRRGRLQARILVLRDVTKRKREADELRRAKEAAEAGNEAKTRFLSVMSHELRTPMNGMMGFASLLRTTPLNADQSEYARAIEQSGENLLALIEDMLGYAEITSGGFALRVQPFSLAPLIAETCAAFLPRAQHKQLALRWMIDADVPPTILADPLRVGQILRQLVDNAIKFTERGGVEVRVSCTDRKPDAIDGGRCWLTLVVRDTGIGITSEATARIMQPFGQVDDSPTRKHGGTGLGLATARRLCEHMRGNLTVASRPGEGATFIAWFEAGLPDAESKA